MGRVRKSSCPGESRLDCKGKASDQVMEKETCYVGITSDFASVLIINPNIFYSEMSALCHRKSPGVLRDSLCLAVLNAEVFSAFRSIFIPWIAEFTG